MFHPGETVTHRFYMPFAPKEVSKVIVTFKQADHIILVREITSLPDELVSEFYVDVDLTQEESLLFQDLQNFTTQVQVLGKASNADNNGLVRCTSREMKGSNGIQHYREVIS